MIINERISFKVVAVRRCSSLIYADLARMASYVSAYLGIETPSPKPPTSPVKVTNRLFSGEYCVVNEDGSFSGTKEYRASVSNGQLVSKVGFFNSGGDLDRGLTIHSGGVCTAVGGSALHPSTERDAKNEYQFLQKFPIEHRADMLDALLHCEKSVYDGILNAGDIQTGEEALCSVKFWGDTYTFGYRKAPTCLIVSETGIYSAPDGRLTNGKITYLPCADNGYKESEEGLFGPDGRLTNGKKRYSKRLFKNFFHKTRKVNDNSIWTRISDFVLRDKRLGMPDESVV